MPVGWASKTDRIQQLIQEEELRLEEVMAKAQLRETPRWFTPETPFTQAPQISMAETPQMPQWTSQAPQMAQMTQPIPERIAPITRPQPSVAPTPQVEEPEWYEVPKVYAEGAMEKVGEAISKVPILPEALEFVAPAFKWIHENLEKPFAAIITSPFSPDIAWNAGESWIDHQKREYDAWDAPTYVKGVAEFAMPLWWIPWFAWAGKGAKALGFGTRTTKEALKEIAKKGGKLATVAERGLPSGELLDNVLFRANRLQAAMEKVPVVNKIVKMVGGPGVFITKKEAARVGVIIEPVGADAIVKTNMALVKYGFISDMRNGIKSLHVPKLQVLEEGGLEKLLGLDSKGVVSNIVDKSGKSQYLYDVLEGAIKNPDNYTFVGGARKYVDELRDILDDVYKMAGGEGVRKVKDITLHRMVSGKTNPSTGIYEKSEYGSLFEVGRTHKLMKEGVEAGVDYGLSINDSISSTIDHYVKKIATKRFSTEVGKLGRTAEQLFTQSFPEQASQLARLTGEVASVKYAQQALSRLSSYAGGRIPARVLSKIRKKLPEVGKAVDNALLLTPDDTIKVVSKLSRDLKSTLKLSTSEVNDTVRKIEYIARAFRNEKDFGKVMYGDIEDAVRFVTNKAGTKADIVEAVYKEAYILKRTAVKDAIKSIRGEVDSLLRTKKTEMSPLSALRNRELKRLKGKQILGRELAKFNYHPAFGEMIFPKDVVKTAEKLLNDNSQDWLAGVANVSGTSRMLTAAMDTSAPFIQGLAAWGRNPVAWADAVGQMFKFAAKPHNLYKYLSNSEVMATRMERIMAGGSSSTFEYFKALAPLQKQIGKIPIVGKQFDKLIGETYGRAEAAFTGFGEVARNNLWKSLRHKTLKDGVVSPDLAMDLSRSLDRMTGVMSTEALGIGRTQQDFENAFVFFAPRYTRAGLIFVSDALRGGMAGSEARVALGNMMSGGVAMYYGACKSLGQAPNFNPSSGRFMTVKVGDSHIGIGGIMIALGRLGYDIAVTAAEDPINLIKPISEGHLNRWDNPFIRFLYSRTSPVTSGAVSTLLEQANYFGEPFENIGDWGKFMLDKVTPIAAQELTDYMTGEREEPPSPITVAAEFGGLRAFPKSPWELMDEQRDEVSLREYGQPYDNLNDLQQTKVDKSDAVVKLQKDVDAQTVTRGDAVSVGFLNRQRERDVGRQVYENTLWNLQKAYDDGIIDGVVFREKMSEAGYGLGVTYKHIDSQPEYKEVMSTLEKPRKITDKHIEDIAYSEFMNGLYQSNEFEDQYGLFQYDKYYEYIENFRAKYGEEIYQYILDRQTERNEALPELAKEYQKAKIIMRPYWKVQEDVENMFGKYYAESSAGQAFIQKQRKMLRMSNPELERYYQLFYARSNQ